MHLYIKLAFCLALPTDKWPQPSELRRNLELVSQLDLVITLKFLKFLTKLLGKAIPYSAAIIKVWLDKTFVYFTCSVH